MSKRKKNKRIGMINVELNDLHNIDTVINIIIMIITT